MELRGNAMVMASGTGKVKAQMMSLTVLLILILILAEFFSFVVVGILNSNIAQSTFLSRTSSSVISMLKQSAPEFGSASAKTALATLSYYEYDAAFRGDNFIANTSEYLGYLMTNGMLPKVAPGSAAANYLKESMGNLTFKAYNSLLISNFSGAGLQAVNESSVSITQQVPYALNVSYTETINISVGGLASLYSFPVSFSVPINNTPDLFYAQQGIMRYIRFSALSNLTSLIANKHARTGNVLAYAYGTVYYAPGSSCPALAAGVSQNTILVSNAVPSANCENSFAGFITNTMLSAMPTVPYLVYANSIILSSYFTTGQSALLYGPQLSALNIENLRQAMANGDYIASPFLPSYLSRANDSFNASGAGISTFQGYNRQAASFNGVSSNITTGTNNLPASPLTIGAWVYPASISQPGFGTGTGGTILESNENGGTSGYILGIKSNGELWWWPAAGQDRYSTGTVPLDTWTFITLTYNGVDVNMYLNGRLDSSQAAAAPQTPTFMKIGSRSWTTGFFEGSMSNIQLYNTSLSSNQVKQLYARGIEGLPVPNNGLVGWWPLNGNGNDYSGQENTGTPTNVVYSSATGNYLRDSLMQNYTGATYPIPGIQSCISTATCSNALPDLYLGGLPLEPGSLFQTVHFNGSAYMVGNTNVAGGTWTVGMWLNADNTIPSSQFPAGFSGINGLVVANSLGQGTWGLFNGVNTIYGPTINANQWYYLAVTGVLGTYTIYTNGEQSNTAALGSIPINSIQLGRRQDGSLYFNGSIANLQIYSQALPAANILSLYNEGISGAPLPNYGLVDWEPMDGNCNDYSYNGNGCTLTQNVIYPYFSGNYPAPGSPGGIEGEWQALGFGSPP